MKRPVALITGISGQDGSYLAELLLNKGYIVHGLKRRPPLLKSHHLVSGATEIELAKSRLFMHFGDLNDSTNLIRVLKTTKPDEIYNLAAQSHVHLSFHTPENTAKTDAIGVLRLLEGIRILGMGKSLRFYQASTSDLFGKAATSPQNELTPFHPRSPYGVAKLYAYWITVNYREAHGFFACNGILFNHESPRRRRAFVTRKITRAAARIKLGLQKSVKLGNLDASRDWGHAKDYVEGMWRMLQHKVPDDFVLATGKTTTVRFFCQRAFEICGMELEWHGSGTDEHATCKKTGNIVVEVDPRFYRPIEPHQLVGDPTKAQDLLGWSPRYTLNSMIEEMVQADLEKARADL